MNIFNRFLSPGNKPRKRSMRQQLDDIEDTLYDLTDAVGKIHADMWDKLTTLEEQERARPSIVLGMPTESGADILTLEPLEQLEPLEEVSNDGE